MGVPSSWLPPGLLEPRAAYSLPLNPWQVLLYTVHSRIPSNGPPSLSNSFIFAHVNMDPCKPALALS